MTISETTIRFIIYVLVGYFFNCLYSNAKKIQLLKGKLDTFHPFTIEYYSNDTEGENDLFDHKDISNKSIWPEIIKSYSLSIPNSGVISSFCSSVLQKLLPVYKQIAKVVPSIILLTFLIQLFTKHHLSFTILIETIHLFIILIAIFNIVSFPVIYYAYKSFLNSHDVSHTSGFYIFLLFFILHTSFVFRPWIWYWLAIRKFIWIFEKDGSSGNSRIPNIK